MTISSLAGPQRNMWQSFHLNVTPPDLTVHQEPARLEIHQEQPELFIDQTRCFAEKGSQPPLEFAAAMAQKSWQGSMGGIERRVWEGNQLGKLGKRQVNLIQILSRWEPKEIDYNVDLLPRTPPEIEVVTHPVEIRTILGFVQVELAYGSVRVDVDPIINVVA